HPLSQPGPPGPPAATGHVDARRCADAAPGPRGPRRFRAYPGTGATRFRAAPGPVRVLGGTGHERRSGATERPGCRLPPPGFAIGQAHPTPARRPPSSAVPVR
ncbi:MAG: hypothetical protein ACR2MN_18225, partial [Acidimicrobiales bacterium]